MNQIQIPSLFTVELVRGLISFGFSWLVLNMRQEISNIH